MYRISNYLYYIQSSRYLEPTALFQGELIENLSRINEALDVLRYFK